MFTGHFGEISDEMFKRLCKIFDFVMPDCKMAIVLQILEAYIVS